MNYGTPGPKPLPPAGRQGTLSNAPVGRHPDHTMAPLATGVKNKNVTPILPDAMPFAMAKSKIDF
jgi:hypothetical protein